MSEGQHIHSSAKIGQNCEFGYNVIIGKDCTIGDGVVFHNNVVVYDGVSIGAGSEIYDGACIGRPPKTSGNTVCKLQDSYGPTQIGQGCVIGAYAVIYADTVLEDRVLVGDHASIREQCHFGESSLMASFTSTGHHVRLGKRSKVMNYTHLVTWTDIGDDVFIGVGVISTNDNKMRLRGKAVGEGGGMKVADKAKIGSGSIMLAGVHVGRRSVVGAGSLVNCDVEEYAFVNGMVPAKKI